MLQCRKSSTILIVELFFFVAFAFFDKWEPLIFVSVSIPWNNSSDSPGKLALYYIDVTGGSMHSVPDQYTASRLGWKNDSTTLSASLVDIAKYIGHPLPTLVPLSKTADYVLAAELDRIAIIQYPKVIISSDYIGDFFHPCVCRIPNGSFLMVSRGWQTKYEEIPRFHHLQESSSSSSVSYEISNQELDINYGNCSMRGREQVRMIMMPDKKTIHLSFAVPAKKRPTKMHSAELSFSATSNQYVISNQKHMLWRGVYRGLSQKNWVPFVYQSEIHFVQNIFPFTVITQNKSMPNSEVCAIQEMTTVSIDTSCIANSSDIQWAHGTLRGGTQALPVGPGGDYLSFFHSLFPTNAQWNGIFFPDSYWMGAYTFSAKKPFKITGISRVPIVERRWYQGAWFQMKKQPFFGYIIYPMGFEVVKDASGKVIILSLSTQDRHGFLVRINYTALMNSMKKIKCNKDTHRHP